MNKNSRSWGILQLAKKNTQNTLVQKKCTSEQKTYEMILDEALEQDLNFVIGEETVGFDESIRSLRVAMDQTSDFSKDDSIRDPIYNCEDEILSIANEEEQHLTVDTNQDIQIDTLAKRSRWKKASQKTWKRNVNRKKKSQCLSYKDQKGNLKPKKAPKQSPTHKCKFHCANITENSRLKLCKTYWDLNFVGQKNFILQNVECLEPKYRRPRKESAILRQTAKKYFFIHNDIKTRVCQLFFLSTLNISNRCVISAFLGRDEFGGHFSAEDKRGKKTPTNKTKPEIIQNVKKHIESFPSMESHYCRKNSQRKYLDSKLSIRKMYALYKIQYPESSVSEITYRRIFCNDYNLSFFVPKKDQCLLCNKYKISAPDAKLDMKEDYENHLRRKKEAFEEKQTDKERSNLDKSFRSISMDMQSVLQIPSTDVSLTYYKRKLIVHNFTIYESGLPNNAFCFAWSEVNGKGGSCEVGSCILKYIEQLPENVKELTIFSDTCAGQNRNVNIVALFLNLVQTSNLHVVEQKFLESGHSYMEVDSMHSAIEKQKKFMSIYCINDWLNIFRGARVRVPKKLPYEALEMKFENFYNLKLLAENLIKNKTVDIEGQKINWLKIKCFRYEKNKPGILQFKYEYGDNFRSLNVVRSFRRGRNPVPNYLPVKKWPILYTEPLKISEAKKKDLMEMCKKGVIPEIFHSWFSSLPSESKIKDYLPEPDVLDQSDIE